MNQHREAGRQSRDARIARTGRAMDPSVSAAGRAKLHATCCALVQAHAPAVTDLDAQAKGLYTAFLRAHRKGWTTLPLGEWAPLFLRSNPVVARGLVARKENPS